jgi:predicted permease
MLFVTGNYFTDLGARPREGRLFDQMDDRAGAPPVIVIRERLWRSRFGADPSTVGRAVTVNGHPFVVAGIVPDGFDFHDTGALAWAPIAHHQVAFPGSRLLDDEVDTGALRVYARLRDGVTLEQAQAALIPAARALHQARPAAAPPDEWIHLSPAGNYLPLEASNAAGLALASALVLLLLVTACMNLGLLVLARTLSRDREFSIRLSVGASRGRIFRQLVTEQLMLAGAGALAGCFVAAVATKLFGVLTRMPGGIVPQMTARSLAVAIGLALLSALLFGFAPVLQSMRPAVSRRLRVRTVLVGIQVAAAMVLLIVSGLIVRGITRVVRVPLGFDYRQAAYLDPDLTSHGATPAKAQAYWLALEQRVSQLPGVAGTALTTLPPFGNRVSINGDSTVLYGVTPSYFATMGIRVVRGRVFEPNEAKVVVVSESLARRQWAGEDPIGKLYDGDTVIGVARDARSVRIGDRTTTECYYAIRSVELPVAVMVIRASGEPRSIAASLVGLAREQDAGVLPTIVLLSDALEARLESVRQFALVASALGLSALLLAVVGLGGMVAFTVSQRLREIGIRVALGAAPHHVLRAIARQFAWPVGVGALAGSVLAAGVGTIMSRELFGISQMDPVVHGGAFLLFASVAAVASLPSARRALRVDPARTLRHE